jgi:AcrR family transcriptional regulator
MMVPITMAAPTKLGPASIANMARPRSDIQDRILAAAHVRFLAEGVDAASLRNIAKDADTSIGMVYYYYATKSDLFLAIVEDIYQKFLTDLEGLLALRSGYRERMCGIYARIGSMSKVELDVVRLVLREALSSNDRRERLRQRFLRGHLPLLFRAMLEGSANGELDPSLHPLMAMACSMGIGVLPTLMLRMANEGEALELSAMPDFLRDAVAGFLRQTPSTEDMADLLSQIAVRAIGKR